MLIKTRGIVLQQVKYSESSLIVRIFTENLGLVSYIVKGVRSAKNQSKASILRPLTLLEMDVDHRENKGLQNIKEYRRSLNYQKIPFDTMRSAIGLFILEVVSHSLREHDVHDEMFQFVYDCFCHLDESEPINNDFHIQFLVHYAGYLGFGPHGIATESNPIFDMREGTFVSMQSGGLTLDAERSRIISTIIKSSMLESLPIRLNRQSRQEILHTLLKYYTLHLDGFSALRSLDVLEVVFD